MKQRELELPTWGGRRKGAGRQRASARRMMPHRARPEHMGRHPTHVTLRVVRGVPKLRARKHAHQRGIELPRNWIEPYSSGDYFSAWGGGVVVTPRDPFDEVMGPPVSPAKTWLITRGLERARPIYLHEVPALAASGGGGATAGSTVALFFDSHT